jgi:hypothetical protein
MSRVLLAPRRRTAAAAVVLAVLLAASAMQGCTPAPGQQPGSPTGTSTASASSPPGSPLTAELNQFRDNYGKQIIEIQLRNITSATVTVLGAELASLMFRQGSVWQAAAGGTDIPPGQTKSLPAQLQDPSCQDPAEEPTDDPAAAGAPAEVRVSVRQSSATIDERLPASDPFGVLARNYAEMCLTQDAARVAVIGLAPDLEVAADARTAVVRLTVTPRETGAGTPGRLTIERIEGTTLLAEPPESPWPHGVTVVAGGGAAEYNLRIRPARCDPHAVAEDKVGTLLPLLVNIGGREGTLKVAAGAALKGRIYDFVTAACGAH